jgi:hypothetical protein
MSASGCYQITCDTGGNIYTSENYGLTWSTATNISSNSVSSVAISSTGQYFAAIDVDSKYYSKINMPAIDTTINSVTYNAGTSTLTLPAQKTPVSNFKHIFATAGDSIGTINFTLFPIGYQTTIFIDGSVGTVGTPCVINGDSLILVPNFKTNITGTVNLFTTSTAYAILTINYDGTNYYCNVVAYY